MPPQIPCADSSPLKDERLLGQQLRLAASGQIHDHGAGAVGGPAVAD